MKYYFNKSKKSFYSVPDNNKAGPADGYVEISEKKYDKLVESKNKASEKIAIEIEEKNVALMKARAQRVDKIAQLLGEDISPQELLASLKRA